MKVIETAGAIIDKVITVLAVFAAALILADALAVSVEVLLRRFCGITHAELFEITEYSLLWITFLAVTWLLKSNGHIRVDIVPSRLSPRNRAILNIITSIICTILFGFITWFSIKLTLHDFQTGFIIGSVLRPLKWPIEIIMAIGFLLLFIEMLRKFFGYLTDWRVLCRGETKKPESIPGGEQ